jgi:hypothetical protein
MKHHLCYSWEENSKQDYTILNRTSLLNRKKCAIAGTFINVIFISIVVIDYRGNNKWTSGTIKQKTRPMSYRVETEAGSEWRRHADQILDSKLTDTKTYDDNIIEPNVSVEYSVTE